MAAADGIATLDEALLDAYLARLGIARRPHPTRAALDHMADRHLQVVPFENLDVVLRRPIRLDTRTLVEKVVLQRRGGFCFELNEAFRALLVTLGFVVRRIEGRVWLANEARFGAAFDHLALVVTIAGEEFLVDVGFGDGNRRPLRLPVDEAGDVSGTYRLGPGREGMQVVERIARGTGGPVQPLYEMTLAARQLTDFAAMCAFHQNDPASVFTRGLICTLPTADGRVTLAGERLILSGPDGRREQPVAAVDRAEMLRQHFGIA